MSTLARTFILHGPTQAKQLHAFLKGNAAAMADQGKPLQVRVSVYRRKRSDEQNALMWVWLTQIADQVWLNGRRFSPEVWNEQFKEELLPEETADGVKKWEYLPNGQRRLVMSTTDLNVSEMAEYLTQLEAHAATELGVTLR